MERTEALAELQDIPSAIRELNTLHRLWKNDLGPVAREQREELWSRFQAATKIIGKKNGTTKHRWNSSQQSHPKRRTAGVNWKRNRASPQNHNAWQNSMRKVNEKLESFRPWAVHPKPTTNGLERFQVSAITITKLFTSSTNSKNAPMSKRKKPHRRSRNHLGRSELAGLCGTYEKRAKRLEKNRWYPPIIQ